jgi:hypothetical protein
MNNSEISRNAEMAKESQEFITVQIPAIQTHTGRVMVYFDNGAFVSSIPVGKGEITMTVRNFKEHIDKALLHQRTAIQEALKLGDEMRKAAAAEIAAGKLDGLFNIHGRFISVLEEAAKQ